MLLLYEINLFKKINLAPLKQCFRDCKNIFANELSDQYDILVYNFLIPVWDKYKEFSWKLKTSLKINTKGLMWKNYI